MVQLCKKLLEQAGLSPDRLNMELISSGEGSRFAEIVNEFSKKVQHLGPLGKGEGLNESDLNSKLKVLSSLVPYIKLVKKEKLRVRLSSEDEYRDLYTTEEIDCLLRDVVSYYIEPDKCQACMTCAKRCPVDAIEGGKNLVHVIDQDQCIKCGTCLEVCPPRFGAVTKLSGQSVPPPIPEAQRAIVRRSKEAA
jgi:Fe-S-cluster-containing hydrogenase component 2